MSAETTAVTSADGTPLAVQIVGEGHPLVIVGGAFSRGADGAEIAARAADRGFRVATFDRRSRGDSGDTAPYSPDREIDDLIAVIGALGSGSDTSETATVVGHSSGAILALAAAAAGAPISRLVLSEPPFLFENPFAADLPERLQAFVDAGEPGDAVVTFQREGVGLPDEMIEQIRQSPMFEALLPMAQSTVYDATIALTFAVPTPEMLNVGVPAVIVRGEQTFPVLIAAADRLATLMPQHRLVIEPRFLNHRADPEALADLLAALRAE
ncbi:alpha/beta fold hydrolase [Schumannella sp. 10F1B-5-1]|uniref:alpha/beta fold hydrolase n=1 Tax=Schumannella sp. 10F1B-5-1 TaxID=2590780 RepID=UPI00112FE1E4|nr:alpha/beta hydrolase [Schumannella sp. 10F1B-5-1]TPW72245.1 alpha/beta hydrolase [Schumannella sp. 10F1B-5-1]